VTRAGLDVGFSAGFPGLDGSMLVFETIWSTTPWTVRPGREQRVCAQTEGRYSDGEQLSWRAIKTVVWWCGRGGRWTDDAN
jgi:hypothetical protein